MESLLVRSSDRSETSGRTSSSYDATMSRKRPLPVSDNPGAKRHLNAALAAELQTLRISHDLAAQHGQPEQNAFGTPVNSSPFLTTSPGFRAAPQPYNSNEPKLFASNVSDGVRFGTDFADALSDSSFYQPQQPEVMSPESSMSSLPVLSDDGEMSEIDEPRFLPPRLETSNDDVVVEDMEPTTENRVVVYRPPVNSSPNTLARINACLPDGSYVFRNPRTDEWIVHEAHSDRMKRKLALVPWRGDLKKVRDTLTKPAKVIPMPWHGPGTSQPNRDETIETMEIEDIS